MAQLIGGLEPARSIMLQLLEAGKNVVTANKALIAKDLPKIENSNDLPSLRHLYDKTESTVRSLRGMGVSTESYATVLTPNIMSKIPL